jgi:hypothetical protein
MQLPRSPCSCHPLLRRLSCPAARQVRRGLAAAAGPPGARAAGSGGCGLRDRPHRRLRPDRRPGRHQRAGLAQRRPAAPERRRGRGNRPPRPRRHDHPAGLATSRFPPHCAADAAWNPADHLAGAGCLHRPHTAGAGPGGAGVRAGWRCSRRRCWTPGRRSSPRRCRPRPGRRGQRYWGCLRRRAATYSGVPPNRVASPVHAATPKSVSLLAP